MSRVVQNCIVMRYVSTPIPLKTPFGSPPTVELSHECDTLADIYRSLQDLHDSTEQTVRKQGLNLHQYRALLTIGAHVGDGAMGIEALARQMRIAPRSAGNLLKRIEALKLIRRTTARERRASIVLTARGRKVINTLHQSLHGEFQTRSFQLARLLRNAAEHTPSKIPQASPACLMPEIED